MIWQATSNRDIELIEKQSRIENALTDFRGEIPPPSQDLPWEMRKILGCVHRDLFEQNLNVAVVRQRCRLRNNNISTRFRCAVGMGLRDYIEAGRMEAAKWLLRHKDLEIYLIAMAVGYEHQETFCRAFQRQAGCTPSEWREAQAGTGSPEDAVGSDCNVGPPASPQRQGDGHRDQEVLP